MNRTTTTGETKPFSINEILKAKAALESNILEADWILVSPNGIAYSGSPQDLIIVLAPYHPLLKR